MYSMAPALLQTSITHSGVWLWCRAKVPINSGSRSRGCGCAFGNLTVSPSPERSTAAGSAHPLIVTNGSGHSNTSPRVRTHHKNWEGEFSTALQGIVLLQKNVSKSQHEPLTSRAVLKTRLCNWKRNMVAVWRKTLHRHQNVSFFQDLRKTGLLLDSTPPLHTHTHSHTHSHTHKHSTLPHGPVKRVPPALRAVEFFSAQIETFLSPMFKIGVARFSHDDTDILLYKAFMRSSVLSSTRASLFPLICALQLHGLWACPILLFQRLCGFFFFFSVFLPGAAAHRPADPQLSDTEEIVIWAETPLITLTSQPPHAHTHTDEPPPTPHGSKKKKQKKKNGHLVTDDTVTKATRK